MSGAAVLQCIVYDVEVVKLSSKRFELLVLSNKIREMLNALRSVFLLQNFAFDKSVLDIIWFDSIKRFWYCFGK